MAQQKSAHPVGEVEIIVAFDRFIGTVVELLRAAAIPSPPEKLANIVTGALVGKILRLADAVLALCRGRHGNETGLLLRTLILAYTNLRFIAQQNDPDGAAMRYMRHVDHVRSDLEPHLVRPDVEGEGFPVRAPEAWAAEEAQLAEQWERIEEWAAREGVVEMPRSRPPDRAGKPRPPLAWSWSGLSEAELFDAINDPDAYRWYMWFSNEVHTNVVGIGDLFGEINGGVIQVTDESEFARGPIALAAKYVVLSLERYDELLHLGIADGIGRASDNLSAVLRSYGELGAQPPNENADGRVVSEVQAMATLIDLTDKELKERLRKEAETVRWSANDYLAEMDRRATDRNTRALRTLTIVNTVAALILLVVTALRA